MPFRRFALAAIRAYQRYLSPHKGFSCAYRCTTGRASCSMLGYRAIRRHGVHAGLAILRMRTHRCGVAAARHRATARRPHRLQRGDCDLGCDAGSWDICSGIVDGVSCCDCGSCDWRRKRDEPAAASPGEHLPAPVVC